MIDLAQTTPTPPTTSVHIPESHATSGGRLVAPDGRALILEETTLRAEAGGGIARVTVEQRFKNPYPAPLTATYQLPLPDDGAVSGFEFRLGDRVVRGEVDRRHAARERFEAALISGKTAALLEQVRGSVFTEEVGNIPPGGELTAVVAVDQPLVWLAEGAWEWRFPTVVGPRYLGAEGRVLDAQALSVDVAATPLAHRAHLSLRIADTLAKDRAPESPSHRLAVDTDGKIAIAAAEGTRLDRDLVVRWPVAKPEVGVHLQLARPSSDAHQGCAYGVLTLVPPAREAKAPSLPRDLIILIDTSGSMDGRPLEQARRVVSLLIESLDDRDQIELLEFAGSARRWKKEPVRATADGKAAALKWLRQLSSGGGTEMQKAVQEALEPLRPGAQRQIILVTDGYIGFEREILETVLARLPRSSRLHTVGVGSAVNRSLTRPAARAGAGQEIVIGLDEDPERAARRLFEHTALPIVTELSIEGEGVLAVAPRRLPDLFAGAPAMIALKLAPSATTASVRVRGVTAGGVFERSLGVQPIALGEGNPAITALFGRETVEDLETHAAAGGDRRELDLALEQVGLSFQIATRLTSWVAISEERFVHPDAGAMQREKIPQELPYGTSVLGLGLRPPAGELVEATRIGALRSKTLAEVPHDIDLICDLPEAPAGAPRAAGPAKARMNMLPARQTMRRKSVLAPRWLIAAALILLGLFIAWLFFGLSSRPADTARPPAEEQRGTAPKGSPGE